MRTVSTETRWKVEESLENKRETFFVKTKITTNFLSKAQRSQIRGPLIVSIWSALISKIEKNHTLVLKQEATDHFWCHSLVYLLLPTKQIFSPIRGTIFPSNVALYWIWVWDPCSKGLTQKKRIISRARRKQLMAFSLILYFNEQVFAKINLITLLWIEN